MKTKIQLKNDENTIHVDDVSVSDGVYAKYIRGISYLFKDSDTGKYYFRGVSANNDWIQKNVFTNIEDALKYHIEKDGEHTLYHIPTGKRIVIEKVLTINDLENSDHVGFVDQYGDKGYIIFPGKGFMAISIRQAVGVCNSSYGSNDLSETLADALNTDRVCAVSVSEVYKFDTRKELYAWLAE